MAMTSTIASQIREEEICSTSSVSLPASDHGAHKIGLIDNAMGDDSRDAERSP
jgi:hypothetical protein